MMDGQYSIFDIKELNQKLKPCEYDFNRYIGQRVATGTHTGVITRIAPYYTYIRTDDGDEVIGTPHDTIALDLLKKGDCICCHDKDDAANVAHALCELGINWDFCYEKNGEQGIWIDILEDE